MEAQVRKLRQQVDFLASLGKLAVHIRNMPMAIATAKTLDPLLRQLTELTGDQEWLELANEGRKLTDEIRRDH